MRGGIGIRDERARRIKAGGCKDEGRWVIYNRRGVRGNGEGVYTGSKETERKADDRERTWSDSRT